MILDAVLQEFVDMVSSRTGIKIKGEDAEKIKGILLGRLRYLQLTDPAAYVQHLRLQTSQGLAEWRELIPLLMNGETYFLRDSGQFTLLRGTLLPELIERRKTEKLMRIWSAGCSTGEEAYSLAILVDQLIPFREGWRVWILGTDINPRAIVQARRGIYGQWAFRMVDSELRQQYFLEDADQWILRNDIRDLVTFRCVNVVSDEFPSPAMGIYDMDLILCRNVFLYFHQQAIEDVVEKMIDTLSVGGYLVTGHNELRSETVNRLHARVYPDSIIYQRREDYSDLTA